MNIRRTAKMTLLLFLLAAAFSCESPKVLWVRIDASNMSISCVNEFELTFTGKEGTQITGSSTGTWRGSAVSYRTEGGSFIVLVSPAYIQEEVPKNASRFPGQFVFELPIQGIGGSGIFDVTASWRYWVVDRLAEIGTAHGTLNLPDSDSIFSLIVFRTPDFVMNVCPTELPDAEVAPEEVEDVVDQEGEGVEDIEATEGAEAEGTEEAAEAAEIEEAGEETLDRVDIESSG